MPEECAYAALTEDYMQRTNAPAGSDYCFVDLGHNGIRMHILQDGNFTTKRSVDLGLRDLEQTISDVRGVDIHMAHAHILSDYNDVLSEDVSAELFSRMAIEIMKAVNFYNYNNRERSLRRIYLCGGGVAVDQIRAAICRVTDLDVHNAEELLPQHDALEAAWLYIKAIGCALQK